ncbi:hypothetical protein [Streptomyces sp. NRRL S-350]|uniref:hypothetical protein n=1 Tax=Streptomyces sp. NRRL S-350 TaxID=1463902 RepID=UPI0004C141F6|nr:hypothetical protein [Streptomyces sp. NRRL S-350]
MLPGQLNLATCTYQEYRLTMGVPVRTTAGAARSFFEPVAGHARTLTPSWGLLAADLAEDAYELRYRDQLDKVGVAKVRAELEAIGDAIGAGDTPLVLLCFDVLSKPGNFCHRQHFASWWTERTGQQVPELGAKPRIRRPAPAPALAQPALF